MASELTAAKTFTLKTPTISWTDINVEELVQQILLSPFSSLSFLFFEVVEEVLSFAGEEGAESLAGEEGAVASELTAAKTFTVITPTISCMD